MDCWFFIIYNKKWEQPIIQAVLILHTNIITRTGIEPVTPPWEGDVLTNLTNGQLTYSYNITPENNQNQVFFSMIFRQITFDIQIATLKQELILL